jgi:hypothetical protein
LPVENTRKYKSLTERKVRLSKWVDRNEIALLENFEESADDGNLSPDRTVREAPSSPELADETVKDLRRNEGWLVDSL